MARTESIKIKDCTYTVKTVDGVSCGRALGVLLKYCGGPLGVLFSGGVRSLGELPPGAMSAILGALGEALTSSEFEAMVFKLLEGSKVQAEGGPVLPLVTDGNVEILRGHFSGDVGALLALYWFAINTNFSGFSTALSVILPGKAQ